MMGPAPFEAELDVSGPGVVGGLAGLQWVAAGSAWRGAHWLVVTPEQRLPATLTASGAVDWLHFDWVMAHPRVAGQLRGGDPVRTRGGRRDDRSCRRGICPAPLRVRPGAA